MVQMPPPLAGARQATRLRQQFLQAVLRQEPAFFDQHVKSGNLLQGLNEDTSAIQLAIGEKVHANLIIILPYCSCKNEWGWTGRHDQHVSPKAACV